MFAYVSDVFDARKMPPIHCEDFSSGQIRIGVVLWRTLLFFSAAIAI